MELLVLLCTVRAHPEPELVSVSTDPDTLAKMRDAYLYQEKTNQKHFSINDYDFFYVKRTLNTTVYNGSDTSIFTKDHFEFNPPEESENED